MEVLLFVVIYALLNRAAGAGDLFPGIGRSIYLVAPAAGLVAYVLTGSAGFGGVVTLCWAIYRVPGWYKGLDMGRNNGTFFGDWLLMSANHARYAPFFGLLFYFYTEMTFEMTFWCTAGVTILAVVLGGLSYVGGHLMWSMTRKSPTSPEARFNPGRWSEIFAGASLGYVTAFAWSTHLLNV